MTTFLFLLPVIVALLWMRWADQPIPPKVWDARLDREPRHFYTGYVPPETTQVGPVRPHDVDDTGQLYEMDNVIPFRWRPTK